MQPAESSHPAHSVWSHFTAEPRVARSLCHECHIFDRHGGARACASAAVELWQGFMAETFMRSVADVKLLSHGRCHS
jgi:hypothetical protein